MKKQFNNKREEKQIEWANMSHEAEFNYQRTTHYYAIIENEGTDRLYHYDAKFRSEAREYFLEQTRLDHGKFKVMGVFI